MDKIKPHLDEDGTLVIPFECADHGYKYWKQEGRSLADILTELGVDEATWAAYTNLPYPASGESGVQAGASAVARVTPHSAAGGFATADEGDDESDESVVEVDAEAPSPSEANLAHPASMA
ncbi:MAG: hypothetical protein ABIK45_03690 [Pseudomonadota bacterium]